MNQRGEHEAVPWYRKGVLYQVYPLSFADANGDGYGDLRGLIEHLDYLGGSENSLGVAAIWLSPVYASPMKDFGYDVSDFRAIDPVFGSMADFEELVTEVHARGMKLIMDFVPNHTSDQHAWFREALQSRASAKRDWYIWADPKADGSEPNNWQSLFGGSAWKYEPTTGQYYLHTFLAEQPDLNWHNPEVRSEMASILRYWLEKGVDGFRTDSAYYLIKDRLLRDDPINPHFRDGDDPATRYVHTYSGGQEEIFDLLDGFCDVVAGDGGSILLSESYLGIEQMQRMYRACTTHPIHMPFNFNLMSLPWGAEHFGDWIDTYEASLGPDDVPNYVLGNHDRPRLMSRVGAERARLLVVLQMTLRGLPVVYYGDELGLPNTVVSTATERDPWGKQVPGLGLGRDIARAPMPWSGDSHNGFSSVEPWLPAAPGSHRLAVSIQDRDPESLLHLYRQLIHLKAHSSALSMGRYLRLRTDHTDVLAFEREYEGKRCIVVINFASSGRTVSVEGGYTGRLLTSTHQVYGDDGVVRLGSLRLKGFEARVYEAEWTK